jgi:hypothetical protein
LFLVNKISFVFLLVLNFNPTISFQKRIMGKKKHSAVGEKQEKEQEYTEMPPGWKEPSFTKEDNPQGMNI